MYATTDLILRILGKDDVVRRRMVPGAGNRQPPKLKRRSASHECTFDLQREIDFTQMSLTSPQPDRSRRFTSFEEILSPLHRRIVAPPPATLTTCWVRDSSDSESERSDDDLLNTSTKRIGFPTPPPPRLTGTKRARESPFCGRMHTASKRRTIRKGDGSTVASASRRKFSARKGKPVRHVAAKIRFGSAMPRPNFPGNSRSELQDITNSPNVMCP
jgi:hypothetical protein